MNVQLDIFSPTQLLREPQVWKLIRAYALAGDLVRAGAHFQTEFANVYAAANGDPNNLQVQEAARFGREVLGDELFGKILVPCINAFHKAAEDAELLEHQAV